MQINAITTTMKRDEPIILLADQNIDDSMLLARYLARSEFSVYEVSSIDDMKSIANEVKPDLAIIAENMAPIDGFEICKILRADKSLHVPYIMMILEIQTEKKIYKSIIAGADDYVVRPNISSKIYSYQYITKFIYENIHIKSRSVS